MSQEVGSDSQEAPGFKRPYQLHEASCSQVAPVSLVMEGGGGEIGQWRTELSHIGSFLKWGWNLSTPNGGTEVLSPSQASITSEETMSHRNQVSRCVTSVLKCNRFKNKLQ